MKKITLSNPKAIKEYFHQRYVDIYPSVLSELLGEMEEKLDDLIGSLAQQSEDMVNTFIKEKLEGARYLWENGKLFVVDSDGEEMIEIEALYDKNGFPREARR